MARLDRATARKWSDEEKARTGGKTDYTATLDAADNARKRLDDAKNDPDEAVAAVARMAASPGYSEAMRLGNAVLATDKPTALRFAEEAVVKARTLALPNRIYLPLGRRRTRPERRRG